MKLIEAVSILALVACFAGSCACVSSGTSVTDITPYRYHVSVQCPIIMCNGVIVSAKNVLTTASCVSTLTADQVQINAGSNKYYEGGVLVDVSNIFIYPSYDRSTFDGNVAVLTVATPFDFSSGIIGSISLAQTLPPSNAYVTVTGFGSVDPNLTLPNVLQKTLLLVYPRATCQIYKKNRLTNSMFCAGDPKGEKDLCPGDQGAPAVYGNALVGIYNWGCSCGLAEPNPSSPVFNSIIPFRNWIQQKISQS